MLKFTIIPQYFRWGLVCHFYTLVIQLRLKPKRMFRLAIVIDISNYLLNHNIRTCIFLANGNREGLRWYKEQLSSDYSF